MWCRKPRCVKTKGNEWPTSLQRRVTCTVLLHTVRSLHFLSKNSTLISRENCRFFLGEKDSENVVVLCFFAVYNFDFTRKIVDFFFGRKIRENVVILDFLAVDNFHFTRKIVKKNLGEKLMKMLGLCQNWIFGQKFDFSNSVF